MLAPGSCQPGLAYFAQPAESAFSLNSTCRFPDETPEGPFCAESSVDAFLARRDVLPYDRPSHSLRNPGLPRVSRMTCPAFNSTNCVAIAVVACLCLSTVAGAQTPTIPPDLFAPPAIGHSLFASGESDSLSDEVSSSIQLTQLERLVNAQEFQIADPAPVHLPNNFTDAPMFSGGLIVVSPDAALKIGGYVKADLIHDFNAIDSPDSFVTTAIPTSGPNRQNSRFHARQSRLSFDTRWRVEDRLIRAFVEADFFGGESNGNSNLRLRHAYGKLDRFTAGQTWTTFTDPSAVPQTLDFEGAVSNVNRRQGLVRWDQPILVDGLSLALAVENSEVVIEAPSLVTGVGRSETPDFISRLRYENDWGEFQGAFVLRELGFQPTGDPVLKTRAWGFNFTGSFYASEQTKGYYQITFGEGIGSYRGSPDIVATGPDTAMVLPMFGWMVGVHHEWTDSLTSNVTFSQLVLDDLPGQDPNNLRNTTYFAANLIANPYERVFVGVEYLYGVREDVSGAQGVAHRLQMSFGFFLP